MNRCLRCFGWAVVAAFFFANGCGSPTSTGLLQPGAQVQLIGEEGVFGKIQTAEGEVGYVPLGMLKQRNTAEVELMQIIRTRDCSCDRFLRCRVPSEPIAPLPPAS